MAVKPRTAEEIDAALAEAQKMLQELQADLGALTPKRAQAEALRNENVLPARSGDAKAKQSLEEARVALLTLEEDRAEMAVGIEQVGRQIAELEAEREAAVKRQKVKELHELRDQKFAIDRQIEGQVEPLLPLIAEYERLCDDMARAGVEAYGVRHPQLQSRARLTDYLQWRLSGPFPRDFRVPTAKERGLLTEQDKIMTDACMAALEKQAAARPAVVRLVGPPENVESDSPIRAIGAVS